MKPNPPTPEITEEVISAASDLPNGWVYKIDGSYGPSEDIPPEAIIGAWKVNAQGHLTGEFVQNSKYQLGISKKAKN